MCYPVCGMMHIKEPLMLIDKSSLCGGSRSPFCSCCFLLLCLYSFKIKVYCHGHLPQLSGQRHFSLQSILYIHVVWICNEISDLIVQRTHTHTNWNNIDIYMYNDLNDLKWHYHDRKKKEETTRKQLWGGGGQAVENYVYRKR